LPTTSLASSSPPVAFGARGWGLPIQSRYLLDGIGLKQDEDFKSIYLDRAGGARFIAPDASEIARIRAKHAFLKPLTVPANSYPNQPAAIDSVGSWSFVLARESLPDDVAYRLARTLHGVEMALCKKLPQACETTAANTVAAAPNAALIHPGAMKYFREAGVVKQANSEW
jgi:hypothetical protein